MAQSHEEPPGSSLAESRQSSLSVAEGHQTSPFYQELIGNEYTVDALRRIAQQRGHFGVKVHCLVNGSFSFPQVDLFGKTPEKQILDWVSKGKSYSLRVDRCGGVILNGKHVTGGDMTRILVKVVKELNGTYVSNPWGRQKG